MHRYARSMGALAIVYAGFLYSCGSGKSGSGGPESADKPGSIEEACAEFADAAGWSPGETAPATATASSERIVAVGEATWPLALDLMRSVPVRELMNLAQSPASFYAALGMAYSRWPDGKCGASVARVLRFPETDTGIHEAIGATLRELRERSMPAAGEDPAVVLSPSLSRWTFGTESAPSLGDIERAYGATPHGVTDHGAASRSLINCVIEHQSNGLLKDFIPPGVIDPDTQALDINVTYLKAPWPRAFTEARVDFRPEGKEPVTVDGLYSSALSASYYESATFNALHVPLRGEKLQVLLVVPNDTVTKNLEEFVTSLTAGDLTNARDGATRELVNFRMPKVKIESSSLLYEKRLPFECELFTMGNLVHGAAVVMDEGGIEAVAATVVETKGDGDFEVVTRTFLVDRPFLFFVYDTETRMVVFSGRVLEVN